MSGLKQLNIGTSSASRLPERSREIVAAEPLKRLTIDLPESMHTRLKQKAAIDKTTIRELIIAACSEILAGEAKSQL